MRMVHALARPGLERPAARDHRPRRRAQRVERRLLERGGVDVRRARLAVDGDVDPALVVVGDDLHPPSPNPEPRNSKTKNNHTMRMFQPITMSRFESSNMTLRPLCIAATVMHNATE